MRRSHRVPWEWTYSDFLGRLKSGYAFFSISRRAAKYRTENTTERPVNGAIIGFPPSQVSITKLVAKPQNLN